MVFDISKTLYSTVFYFYLLMGSISMGTAVLYNAKPNSFPEQKLRKKIIDSMITGMIIIVISLVFDIIISGFNNFIGGQGIYPIITSFSFVFTMFFWKSLNPHDYKLGDVIEEKLEVKPEEQMDFKIEVLKGTKKEKEKESENFKEVTLTETLMQQTNEKDEKLSTGKKINLEQPKTKEEHSQPIKEIEFEEIEKATQEEKKESQKVTAPEEIMPPKLEIANERKKLPDTIIVEPQESINKLKSKKEIEEEQKPPWVKDLNEVKSTEPQKPIEQPKEETPKKLEKKKDDFDDIINNLRK